VQVILVITGLGAQTLEEILPGSESRISDNIPESLEEFMFDVPEPNPMPQCEVAEQLEPVGFPSSSPSLEIRTGQSDLDIPAFMRRKNRYHSQATGS